MNSAKNLAFTENNYISTNILHKLIPELLRRLHIEYANLISYPHTDFVFVNHFDMHVSWPVTCSALVDTESMESRNHSGRTRETIDDVYTETDCSVHKTTRNQGMQQGYVAQ
jgi:hypothetical protein